MAMSECSIVLDDDDDTPHTPEDTQSQLAKSKKLPCPKCSFQTMDKTTLERHMRKHNSSFICKVCKIHFPSVSSLIDHYSKRHLAEEGDNTEDQHDCPMCPFSSIEKLEYDKHITRHETAAYLCQICGQPFAKQVSMKWHVKFKHDINTDYDDGQVEAASENSESLTVNLSAEQIEPMSMEELQSELLNREMEQEQDIKPFAKRFKCLFCAKSFSTKLVLRYHAWRSHRERLQLSQIEKASELSQEVTSGQKVKIWNPSKRNRSLNQSASYRHQCPVCTFSTIYKSTFDRHVKKHGEAKFDCDICGMPFTVIGNLKHHKKVHHPDLMSSTIELPKRHKCNLCIYNTSYKSTLERHVRTHGIAKYHCDLCMMPFVFTGSFVTHREMKHQSMSKHVVETVFTCIEDPNFFLGGKILKKRKCPHCNIPMLSASKLNRHLRTHKNAGYYCGTCSVFFHQRLDFENHMRHHLLSLGPQDGQHQNTTQSRVSNISQQLTAGNSTVEFNQSNSPNGMMETEQNLVTDDLATFHNVVVEPSNLNELSNSMVQIYDDQGANKTTRMTKDMIKIDLSETQLSKAALISQLSGSLENNRHFGEVGDSSLKIVSTCGSADQHILGSSGQGSIQNLYDTASGLQEQAEGFQLESSNFLSQRNNYNIGQQSYVNPVIASNSQNFEQASTVDRNLHHEPTNSICTQSQQHLDNGGDLCACKMLRPVHGEVLANAPFKGRYAKLISDFDDFAMRPFACSLCFFRCSILKDLYSHVQNHLTGCNITPTPASAKFNTGPYLQSLALQGTSADQSNPGIPDIEYID